MTKRGEKLRTSMTKKGREAPLFNDRGGWHFHACHSERSEESQSCVIGILRLRYAPLRMTKRGEKLRTSMTKKGREAPLFNDRAGWHFHACHSERSEESRENAYFHNKKSLITKFARSKPLSVRYILCPSFSNSLFWV